MIHLKEYTEYIDIDIDIDDIDIPYPVLTVEEFVDEIQLNSNFKQIFIDWWNINRTNFKIYYFNFRIQHPILGVFINEDGVALNRKMHVPAIMLLFIALHESKHADQFREAGTFGYFDAVQEENFHKFLKVYEELENDANTFAINAFTEMNIPLPQPEQHLRGNEFAGRMVYEMMKKDIKRLNATSMTNLLLKQIV